MPGLHVSAWHDTHDASRAFLHDLVWHLDVAGDHVAFLPNRNCLIVTGAEDVAGLLMAASFAEKVLDEPRAMSGVPLRLAGREWRIFAPESPAPVAEAIGNLTRLSRARHYAEQKELLDKVGARTGADVFHASCTLMQRPDGTRFTYAVWTCDVAATLPEVDSVAFTEVRGDGEPRSLGMAPWARVVEIAGNLMTRTADYPPRHAVDEFPSREQLARLQLTPP
jgi:hypothetical protein